MNNILVILLLIFVLLVFCFLIVSIQQTHYESHSIGLGNMLSASSYKLAKGKSKIPDLGIYRTRDNKIKTKNRHSNIKGLDPSAFHEIYPSICIDVAQEYIRPIVKAAKPELYEPGVVRIHIRCSDVPSNRQLNYELIEYDWYNSALDLLRNHMIIDKIKVHLCTAHFKESPSNSEKQICYEYSKNLVDYLNVNHKNVDLVISCNSVDDDFLLFQSSSGFISGGCGGSFGFFAGALSYGNVVIPSISGPYCREYGKLSRIHSFRKGGYILHSKRVWHAIVEDYKDTDNVIRLCRTISSVPNKLPFSNKVYFINQKIRQSGRYNHMKELCSRYNFDSTHIEPLYDKRTHVSLTKTHYSILKQISTLDEAYYIVFEDDAEFLSDPRPYLHNNTHEFVYLGLCMVNPPIEPTVSGTCSHGYMLTPTMAHRLVNIIDTNKLITEHIDQIFQSYINAPVIRPDLRWSEDEDFIGICYQHRNASWYKGTTNFY